MRPYKQLLEVTVISREIAGKQISRLSGLPGQPETQDGWDDLINALAERAENPEHAKEIIDKCKQITDDNAASRCATEVDIRRLSWETRRTEIRPNPDCPKCFGSGWEPHEKHAVSAVRRCDYWGRAGKQESPVMPHPRDESMTRDPEFAPIIVPLPVKKKISKIKRPVSSISTKQLEVQMEKDSTNARRSAEDNERLTKQLQESLQARKQPPKED